MSADLPLAAASARLRGKPGRPPGARSSGPMGQGSAADLTNPRTQSGAARSLAADTARTVPVLRLPEADFARPPAVASLVPRLLPLPLAAAYLGIGERRLRDLVADGMIPRVRMPVANGGELRKLLFDREDLDRLIATWKDGCER